LPTKYQDEIEQDEGLALLIPDIQETANLVQVGSRINQQQSTSVHFSANATLGQVES
jgi:hypothetical protein